MQSALRVIFCFRVFPFGISNCGVCLFFECVFSFCVSTLCGFSLIFFCYFLRRYFLYYAFYFYKKLPGMISNKRDWTNKYCHHLFITFCFINIVAEANILHRIPADKTKMRMWVFLKCLVKVHFKYEKIFLKKSLCINRT